MKYLITLLVFFAGFNASAQYSFFERFEYPYDYYRTNFYFDTVNCTNNLWQIGKPQKTVFSSAYSLPNALVTDTLNQYPANDTSIFYVSAGGMYFGTLALSFMYKLDIDSLTTVKVELSGDLGLNWIDPMKEDTTYNFYWVGSKPRLDTSCDWTNFYVNMDAWSGTYPGSSVYPHYRTSDTILYRFTIISDSASTHRDGWMIDDFYQINTGRVGINAPGISQASIFPNPSNGTIFLQAGATFSENDKIEVFNMLGQSVYSTKPVAGAAIDLPLPDGVYTIKYSGNAIVNSHRLVIRR